MTFIIERLWDWSVADGSGIKVEIFYINKKFRR
jgi:hypothetical protein